MKIAFLTAGGIAPCLSSSIGALIEQYATLEPEAELMSESLPGGSLSKGMYALREPRLLPDLVLASPRALRLL